MKQRTRVAMWMAGRIALSLLLSFLLLPGGDWNGVAQAAGAPAPQPNAGANFAPQLLAMFHPAAAAASAAASAMPQAPVSVTLGTITVPSSGEAGVNNVYVSGTGFPAGTILPASVSVTFATSCGGASVASTSPSLVQTIVGTTRRLQVLIPGGLGANTYYLSVSGTTTTGTAFASVTCSQVQVTVPSATLSPNSGAVGQQNLSVAITGVGTHFSQGVTTASFGAGITVASLTVASATSATAVVNIAGNAELGASNVTVSTNAEVLTLVNAFTVTGAKPVITQNPVNVTVNAGSTATFTAAATGSPTPTVQWQVSTDGGATFNNVAGATATTLSFATTAGQNGNLYRAVFTNTSGSATTTAATLTVDFAPTVTSNPTNASVAAGSTATFSAAASGNPTPTVQWQVSTDGGATFTNVSGATATTLSLVAVTAGQNGNQYRAVFTNSVGSATTTAATLTVTTSGTPTILSIAPNSSLAGVSLAVTITAQNTHFVNGTTTANFGPGIAVGTGVSGAFGPVTVTSATTATAQLTIAANAPLASRTVSVKTNTEQESLINGFSVVGSPMVLYVSPNSANPGSSVMVSIVGMFTHFQQGVSVANFGAGISVGGGAAGAAGPITVTSPTTATANLTIAAGATLGLRAPIIVTSGTESAPWSSPGFFVLSNVTGAPPTVTITSPTEGATVSSLTTVTGSVVSPNLAYWTLSYQGSGSTTFTQFATGTTTTVSGAFDPTMLVNGIATIQLTGIDQSGQTSSTVVHVSVMGNVKVGNFTLAFNDLNIPVAGIPITLIRTYDSRVKSSEDFGFGWALSYSTVKVETSDTLGNNWVTNTTSGELGLPNYCVQPNQKYVVSVRLQDGTVYQFTPTATAATECALVQPPETVDLQFNPIGTTPANATLTQPNSTGLLLSSPGGGATQLLDQNTFDVYGLQGDTDGWTLTLGNGQVLQLSMTSGLQGLTDTNGNTLSFTATGIISSPSGKSVTYARDSQNRITTITDPNGNKLNYAYNSNGDLTSYTDARGNVSTFSYDGNHDLLSFMDPRGVQPVRTVYDDSGRLIQVIDAFGHVVNLSNDVGANTETVTDALGNPTTFVYDANGNILQETDALGNVYTKTYDSNGNKLTDTNALGYTTSYSYDANNNQLTKTDPLGHTTTFTYGATNKPLTQTDPLGRVVTSAYDVKGNLTSATDALGHSTTYTFNSMGLPLTVTDPLGHTTTSVYDSNGNVTQQTDTLGNVTSFTYDANNNALTKAVARTKSDGTQETLTTQYQYDAQNHLVKTINPDGSSSQVLYNVLGQKSDQIDG